MKPSVIAIIGLLPFCLQAEVYKWVDEQGNVHYGDRPQNEVAVPVQIDKAPAPGESEKASREEMRKRVSDALEEDRLAKEKQRREDKRQRAERQQECNWLKDRQRRFRSAAGLYQLDKAGNRVYLSDAARQSTEKKLQRRINKVCR